MSPLDGDKFCQPDGKVSRKPCGGEYACKIPAMVSCLDPTCRVAHLHPINSPCSVRCCPPIELSDLSLQPLEGRDASHTDPSVPNPSCMSSARMLRPIPVIRVICMEAGSIAASVLSLGSETSRRTCDAY